MELFPSKTKFKPPKEKEGTDKVVVEVEISVETFQAQIKENSFQCVIFIGWLMVVSGHII